VAGAVSERLPPQVEQLIDERAAARAERDFAAADALRERIRAMGWEVVDLPDRSTARPSLPAAAGEADYARPEDLESLLDEPATVAASVQVLAEQHGKDLERFLRGLAAYPPSVDWELVMVANSPTFGIAQLLYSLSLPVEPTVLASAERLGWADARNLGLRRSRGEVTVLVDTSVEPEGDFVAPLLAAFDDPSVGIAGAWGVVSATGRAFEEAPPGEVDAIVGYCLAVRREVLRKAGLFDHHFRFYRNADLDFSFQARAAGWRAIVVPGLPLRRHEHRGYAALPPAERERLSKRNFYRFLKHWGDRRDLLLHPGR
jgi:GT2 family glycosyltransferase